MIQLLKYLWFLSFRRRPVETFVYWTGRSWRGADPILAWVALADDKEFNADVHLPAVDQGDTKAMVVAAGAAQRAFSVPEFNKGGLTVQELMKLLDAFYAHVADQKKSGSESLTPPPFGEPTSCSQSVPSAESACSSTPAEPKPESLPA